MKTTWKWTKGNLAAGVEAALFILALTTFFGDRSEGKIVFLGWAPLLVDAMKWVALAFLGLNVLDNAGKGVFYQEGLADRATALEGK